MGQTDILLNQDVSLFLSPFFHIFLSQRSQFVKSVALVSCVVPCVLAYSYELEFSKRQYFTNVPISPRETRDNSAEKGY
ncbi:MAG: hypothetical protein BA861_03230 [Desulfobacterales bacterium S3730MH5]|nr:MAG: hypothetical protein BA861_03230 [Desulfobacterales bacterium S3730MH5]